MAGENAFGILKHRKFILISLALFLTACASCILYLRKGTPDISDTALSLTIAKGLSREIADGNFPVRMSYYIGDIRHSETNYLGDPIAMFYAPLPYHVIGLIALFPGVGVIAAWKLVILISSIIGIVGMYLLARRILKDDYLPILVSMLYMFSSYRFVDLYYRGAFAEGLAFSIVPWIFYFLSHRLEGLAAEIMAGISLTMLALTHIITAMIVAPFALAFLICRRAFCLSLDDSFGYVSSKARFPRIYVKDLIIAALAFMTAFLSTSLFYIAQILERISFLTVAEDNSSKYGFVSEMTNMSPIRTLFIPFSYYGNVPKHFSNLILPLHLDFFTTISIIAGLVVIIRKLWRGGTAETKDVSAAARLVGIAGITFSLLILIAFITGFPTHAVWRMVPGIVLHMQFPYRLLLFCSFLGVVLLAFLAVRLRLKKLILSILLVLFLLPNLSYVRLENYQNKNAIMNCDDIPDSYYGYDMYQPLGKKPQSHNLYAISECVLVTRLSGRFYSPPSFRVLDTCRNSRIGNYLPFTYFSGYTLKGSDADTTVEKSDMNLIHAAMAPDKPYLMKYTGTSISRSSCWISLVCLIISIGYVLHSQRLISVKKRSCKVAILILLLLVTSCFFIRVHPDFVNSYRIGEGMTHFALPGLNGQINNIFPDHTGRTFHLFLKPAGHPLRSNLTVQLDSEKMRKLDMYADGELKASIILKAGIQNVSFNGLVLDHPTQLSFILADDGPSCDDIYCSKPRFNSLIIKSVDFISAKVYGSFFQELTKYLFEKKK
jgi:hypothetical protein